MATLWLLLGTQLPDLIDKPLAWTSTWSPPDGCSSTRCSSPFRRASWSIRYWRRRENSEGVAFGVGYLSHVFGDAIGSLLLGEYAFVRFLVWPLLSVP